MAALSDDEQPEIDGISIGSNLEPDVPDLDQDATAVPTGSNEQPNPRISTNAAVFDAWMILNRTQRPNLLEPVFDPTNPAWMQMEEWFVSPVLGSTSAVVTDSHTSPPEPQITHWSRLATQRLRFSNLVQTDDQIRWQALRKLKTIVLQDPSMSKLGRSLISGVRLFTRESDWEHPSMTLSRENRLQR